MFIISRHKTANHCNFHIFPSRCSVYIFLSMLSKNISPTPLPLKSPTFNFAPTNYSKSRVRNMNSNPWMRIQISLTIFVFFSKLFCKYTNLLLLTLQKFFNRSEVVSTPIEFASPWRCSSC